MRVARFLLGLLLLLAILAMAAFVLRKPIAGAAVRAVMASAGLENPKARVTALTLNGIALKNISAGPSGAEAFRLERVEADYDWRDLWPARKVEALRIGPGVLRLTVSEAGAVSIPGVSPAGGGGSGALPFESFTVDDLDLYVDPPRGEAVGHLNAEYDVATGGQASVRLSSDRAGFQKLRVESFETALDITFADDGALKLGGNLKGTFFTSAAALQDAHLTIKGEGVSWRDLMEGRPNDVSFNAQVRVESAAIPVASAPALQSLDAPAISALLGDPIDMFTVVGALTLAYANNELVLATAPPYAPPALRSDTGIALAMSPLGDAPYYKRNAGGEEIAFAYALDGAKIEAGGSVRAEKLSQGWRVKVPMAFGAFSSEALSLDGASIDIEATTNPAGVAASVSTKADIREASIGRLNVFDAPMAASFLVEINPVERTAVASLSGECVSFDRVRMTIDGQDSEASLNKATLCADEHKSLAVFDWSGPPQCVVNGVLSAVSGRYRLGRTRIAGRPPQVDFEALYQPQINLTTAAGRLEGGSMVLNDMLIFSRGDGDFDFLLDKAMLKSAARLTRVHIAQNLELPLVAPVVGSGALTLVDKKAAFDYVLRTPEGDHLGRGSGVHNVATGQGSSDFRFERLHFAPGALQPDRIAPVLRGIIGVTIGEASGSADFSWSQQGVASAADIAFKNLTFEGPTRVVSKTVGLNGNIQFANLWPVATGGPQTITVSGVDLDALQLSDGEVVFDMPGDQTLIVERAVFPWFGGELGVYDATASMAGGGAVAPLRVKNVDLAQVFDYIDIQGLSGEGVVSGVLPLTVEAGKAAIENGLMQSDGPGAIRYTGRTAEKAAQAGQQAQIAFDILRDLRYNTLAVTVNGPLDGRLEFQLDFEGTGDVSVRNARGRVPVLYRITLDAALLELLNQANLMRDVQLQIQRAFPVEDEAN